MNSSSSDIETQTLQGASKSAKEKASDINGTSEEEEEISLGALYYGLFDNIKREGALSAINRNTSYLSELFNSTVIQDLGAQRVVITGWNMPEGSTFELPVMLGKQGKKQASDNIISATNLLKGADSATIYSILTILMNALSDDDAFNINLLTADLDFAKWAKGEAGQGTAEIMIPGEERPENERRITKLPPGNGATRPGGYVTRTASTVTAEIM